jgi:predicted HTH domain antitoxin
MEPIVLTIPPEAVAAARLPRQGMEAELQRRLAAALYSDGILPGGVACRMAGMEKADWHYYLGQHHIVHPLTDEDVTQDLQNLQTWRETD